VARERQLELFPNRALTAAERRDLIRRRLEGFEYRQQAREAQRRCGDAPFGDPPRQVTLEEMIVRDGAEGEPN
jgi:hypothetical protein